MIKYDKHFPEWFLNLNFKSTNEVYNLELKKLYI